MKNIKFGVEIELGGESRRKASVVIANYFGTESFYEGTYYDVWSAKDRQGRTWKVMSDSSVHAGNQSCEVVTPLLSYEDIEDLQEVVRMLRANGFRADASCGIHVHVDNTGMTAQQIRNLVNLVSSHEELIYQSLKIRENGRERWCQKTNANFKNTLNGLKAFTVEDVKYNWYMTQVGVADNSRCHYDSSRYHLLNLHSMWQGKGLEFRCFNGTTHAGKIKAYVQFCLALVAKAKEVKFAKKDETARDDSLVAMNKFLNHIGLVGDEFKTCRQHMTSNLTHNDQINVA